MFGRLVCSSGTSEPESSIVCLHLCNYNYYFKSNNPEFQKHTFSECTTFSFYTRVDFLAIMSIDFICLGSVPSLNANSQTLQILDELVSLVLNLCFR